MEMAGNGVPGSGVDEDRFFRSAYGHGMRAAPEKPAALAWQLDTRLKHIIKLCGLSAAWHDETRRLE